MGSLFVRLQSISNLLLLCKVLTNVPLFNEILECLQEVISSPNSIIEMRVPQARESFAPLFPRSSFFPTIYTVMPTHPFRRRRARPPYFRLQVCAIRPSASKPCCDIKGGVDVLFDGCGGEREACTRTSIAPFAFTRVSITPGPSLPPRHTQYTTTSSFIFFVRA